MILFRKLTSVVITIHISDMKSRIWSLLILILFLIACTVGALQLHQWAQNDPENSETPLGIWWMFLFFVGGGIIAETCNLITFIRESRKRRSQTAL
ncbi:MAG: hypothetical protein HZA80_03545 [Candidatus Taylorbacteria bacterium]|nr:hypothetical protein [Candidatus Taylorbacteria bacterium]